MEREDQDDELLENDVERDDDADPGVDNVGDKDDEEAEREAVTSADDTGLVAQERAFNQVPPQG